MIIIHSPKLLEESSSSLFNEVPTKFREAHLKTFNLVEDYPWMNNNSQHNIKHLITKRKGIYSIN